MNDMEVLELDGKTFMKATSVARELGYTSDYVGQLCRSGKIDAHLVGRNWYVDKDSIRDHKSSRYRSSKKKTQEALKTSLKDSDEAEPVKVRIATSSPKTTDVREEARHFYGRMSVPKVKYNEDGSELIPSLTQREVGTTQKLNVRPVDAEKVRIEKTTRSYKMEASELPKIRFEGELSVEEAAEAAKEAELSAEEENTDKKVSPKAARDETKPLIQRKQVVSGEKKRKVLHPTDESPKEMKVTIHQQQVVFSDRLAVLDSGELDVRQKRGRAATEKVTSASVSSPGVRLTLVYVAASALLAFSLSIAALFTEQHYTTNSSSQGAPSLSFNLSAAFEIYERLK